MSAGEYTYLELPPSRFHHIAAYEKWLKENFGYASLSSWYFIQDLGGALAEKLGFHYHSSAFVFFRSEDALMFKLKCPVHQLPRGNGYDPYSITEDYYFTCSVVG